MPAKRKVTRSQGKSIYTIRLNASDSGRVFEGIGAVSAGASSRLLFDYPESQRSQVLDFLFKPKFGAAFQDLKVEIGSGENSTCGSEPSHVITLDELENARARGYEFWLMQEARKRNPDIILHCLPWGYPAWVKDRFSKESAQWIAAFLSVARRDFGLELDWVSAAQNEQGTDLNWIVRDLRPTLDRAGFSNVRLQAPDDDSEYWDIFADWKKNRKARKLIGAVGYHYLDGREPWDIDQENGHAATDSARRSDKTIWASEEWSQSGKQWGATGALYLARLINKLYIRDRATKYQIWCPVDGIYDQIAWHDTGVMQADTPWSGAYSVWPAVWAVAHTTQFVRPGWRYMNRACGQLDANTWRGSHVALRDPRTGDWSLVICTGDARSVRVVLSDGLQSQVVHVWRSTVADQFVHISTVAPVAGVFEFDLQPNALYTFTSTSGQVKGSHGEPPLRAPFPFPFREDFQSYKIGETPRFFSDQKGTFEIVESPQGGLCLAQIVPAEGILWYGNRLLKPHTLFGDASWRDYSVQADVAVRAGDVEVGGRYGDRERLGYRLILNHKGEWQVNWQDQTLAAGRLPDFDCSRWHRLRLQMSQQNVSAYIDEYRIAHVEGPSTTPGMAFLASTYDCNLFGKVVVEA